MNAQEPIEIRSGILTFKSPLREVLENYGLEYMSFEGAVIDLETDENKFLDHLWGADRAKNFRAVCCGVLDKKEIEIIAKTRNASDQKFVQAIEEKLRKTDHPYYAFNAGFDVTILSNLLDREIPFDRELKHEYGEKKKYLAQDLRIPKFDDPFNGEGKLASEEWTKHLKTRELGCVKKIIDHNRACLLTEYGLLIRRGYREIEVISYEGFFKGTKDLLLGDYSKLTK